MHCLLELTRTDIALRVLRAFLAEDMSRLLVHKLSNASVASPLQPPAALARSSSIHTNGKARSADEEMTEARQWLKDLHPETVPEKISEISFCKSVGGVSLTTFLTVNYVVWSGLIHHSKANNSKARLQTPLKRLLPFLPKPLHEQVRTHSQYVQSSDCLVITSSQARKGKDNRDACYRKFFATLQEVGKASIPPENDGTTGR